MDFHCLTAIILQDFLEIIIAELWFFFFFESKSLTDSWSLEPPLFKCVEKLEIIFSLALDVWFYSKYFFFRSKHLVLQLRHPMSECLCSNPGSTPCSSFLPVGTLGSIRWWLKWLGPCQPRGTPALSSLLLPLAWCSATSGTGFVNQQDGSVFPLSLYLPNK